MKLSYEGHKPHNISTLYEVTLRTKLVVFGGSDQLERGAASGWVVGRMQV